MGWHGELRLRYRRDGARTLAHDQHHGPLRVLRALHPEGPGICHHVLVHPPGGIVGGDRLDIDVELASSAHAVLTTPGATRFYRSAGATASQTLHARVADGARLEWLPMETIVHRSARAHNGLVFDLAAGAEMIGWDLLALGLPAAGERFDDGLFDQQIALPGRWLERGVLDFDDPRQADLSRRLLDSPLGWAGRSALATVWWAGGDDASPQAIECLLDTARAALALPPDAAVLAGVTAPNPRIVVARLLASRCEPLWALMHPLRAAWRQARWGLAAPPLRVWQC